MALTLRRHLCPVVLAGLDSRCRLIAIVLAGILVSPSNLAAQRVRDEVVELSNGDRVTGEIKGLDRSQLTVRTIDLGTVQVRWQRVVRLNSNRTLEIELADGRRLQGSIMSPLPSTLEVTGSTGTATVDLASIVVIRPVARSWIGDLTGRIDAGFSYTRGSQVAQSSANAVITNRRPAFESTFAFNAVLTNVEGQPDSSRYLLGYNYYRFWTGRVFVGGLADAQRNRDLGISFRVSVGAGPGYRFLKSQRQELTVLGGPVLVREVPLQGPASTDGLAFAVDELLAVFQRVSEDESRCHQSAPVRPQRAGSISPRPERVGPARTVARLLHCRQLVQLVRQPPACLEHAEERRWRDVDGRLDILTSSLRAGAACRASSPPIHAPRRE